MIILVGAALIGAALGAILSSKADALTFALSIPVGGSLLASAAAILLFVSRSRNHDKPRSTRPTHGRCHPVPIGPDRGISSSLEAPLGASDQEAPLIRSIAAHLAVF